MSRNWFTILPALGLLLLSALPLRAQLDTRLQTGKTDFLDLYQQSTSLKAKPEIATVFDFSGSMKSLMFHPFYQNNDTADADDYRYMVFTLTPKSTSSTLTAGNVYKITAAVKNGCTSAGSATMLVTVNSDGSAVVSDFTTPAASCLTTSTSASYTVTATAVGNTSAKTAITFQSTTTSSGTFISYTVTGGTNTASGGYTFVNASGSTSTPTIAVSGSTSPYAPGTVVTLTVYLSHTFDPESESAADKNITWSATSGSVTAGDFTEVTTNSLYKYTATWTIPTTTTAVNPTQLTPIHVVNDKTTPTFYPTGSLFKVGDQLTLNAYFQQGTTTDSHQIGWSTTNNKSSTYIATLTAPSPSTTTLTGTAVTAYDATSQNVTWTIPAYNTTSGGGVTTAGYVTASLDVSASSYMKTNSITALGTLSGNTKTTNYEVLRKPDGTAVTATDANAVSGSLYGTSYGELDVRNWIRAASHARFKYTSGSVVRTIDLPIPWKITTPTTTTTTRTLSSGVPLSSTTVLDKEVVTSTSSGTTITTTYGSQTNIELDQTYKIEGISNAVLCAHTSTNDFNGTALTTSKTTSVFLNTVAYRPAYISWLFLGKYQASSTASSYYSPAYALKYIVFDAVGTSSSSLAGGQSLASWGAGYGPASVGWGDLSVSTYTTAGVYSTTTTADASNYIIPALTRVQAVKSAAISTWIDHQADVYWAFRELAPSGEAGDGSATTINNSSSTTITGATPIPPTTWLVGNDSGWTVLNNYLSTDSTTTTSGSTVTVTSNSGGHSLNGMARISYLFAYNGTPLTYAMARTLAQFNDPSSVFNAAEGTSVSQCTNLFLLLFTDGLDNNGTGTNNGNTGTPYLTDSGATLSALAGNQAIIKTPTSIDRYGSYWNLFTFAGIAAHLSDPDLGTLDTDYLAQPTTASTTKTGVPSSFLPFAVNQRNGTTFSQDHRVTIMTVGVSLGGKYTDTSSPKRSLFLAAVCGDPSTTTGALTSFHSFVPPTGTFTTWAGVYLSTPTYPSGWTANDWVVDPTDPADYPTVGKRATGAVYYFDATDPTALSNSMKYAFTIAIGSSGNNATSSPNLPYVGATLGQEMYLGNFTPPKTGGVVWPGDLMMFATRTTSDSVTILDKTGTEATSLDSSTAQWSAASAMTSRLWSARKLYTRWPSSSTSTGEPVIKPFTYTGTNFNDGSGGGLVNYVATSLTTTAAKQAAVQFAMGGDISTVTAPTPPTANRSNIMGDIIDSAPTAIEYKWSDVKDSLTSRLAAVGGNRFRLILVGTNQGWIHAFGEVTKTVADSNGDGNTLVTGDVDELWAFMPTDFLANLDYITTSSNSHRFMADGTPVIYHLDATPTGGIANGVVDSAERAVAIVGLRKGGRSYYALDIHDPFTPALKWSLVPDEADYFPTDRIVSGGPSMATVKSVLSKFGFSSSTPAIGRVLFGGIYHDAVFLGGGFSVPEVEANFLDTSGNATKLGRSVMALDAYTGQVLGAVDLTSSSIGGSTIGPVGAGLIPFEFIQNSGMAQRAYFLDYYGGLWSWGSKSVYTAAPYLNFRADSSEITGWSLRKVFQDDNTTASGRGARYTTLPAPWKVSNFPGPAYNGQAVPAAVGVAMVSGDRNNPLDRSYTSSNLAPINHQLTVLFDRQDSRALGLDTASGPDTGIIEGIGTTDLLEGLSTTAVTSTPTTPCSDPVFSVFTSSCSNYFLGTSSSPKYGYYRSFPSINSNGFIAKGINPPIVVSNTLSYSYFLPTSSDPCTGGAGNTYSWLIANVLNPIVNDSRTSVSTKSGLVTKWSGVASDYIAFSTTTVIQAGTVSSTNGSGVSTTTPAVSSTTTQASTKYPKVRVWRTIQ